MRLVFGDKFSYLGLTILVIFVFIYFLNSSGQSHLIKAEVIETCFVCMYQDIPECSELITEQKSSNPWGSFTSRPMNKEECEGKIASTGFNECVFKEDEGGGGKCISRFINECNELKKTTYINYRSLVIERGDFLTKSDSVSVEALKLGNLSCKNPIVFHSGHGQGLRLSCDKVSGCFSFVAPGGTLIFKDSSCETFKDLSKVKEAGEKLMAERLKIDPSFRFGGEIIFTANQATASTCASSFATLVIKPDSSSIVYDKCSKLGYKNYCTNNLCYKIFEKATCVDDSNSKLLKNKICCPPVSYAQRINSTLGIAGIKNEWLEESKSGQCPNLKEVIKAYCPKRDNNELENKTTTPSRDNCLIKARKLCEGPSYSGYFKIDESDVKRSLDGEDLISYSCFVRS